MSFRDPIFNRPSSGGRIENKDYTNHVRWTPKRIAAFSAAVGLPYLAIVVAIAIKFGIIAAIPLVVLAVLVGVILKVLYWLATSNF